MADPNLPSWAKGSASPATTPKADPNLPAWASPTAGSTPGAVVVASPPKKGGGGFLHGVGHFFSQGASDLEHAAVGIPAGVVQLSELEYQALKHDAGQLVHHPTQTQSLHSFVHGDQNPASKKLGQIEAGQARSFKDTAEHPLRNPGITALNALALASLGAGTVARVGEAARVAKAGEGAGGVAKALATKAPIKPRSITVGNLHLEPRTSPSRLAAAGQRGIDKSLERAAAKNPAGKGAALLHGRAARVITRQARQAEQIWSGPAGALKAMSRGLSPAEQKALQVVAEKVPLQRRIAATSARVVRYAKDEPTRVRHEAELKLLHDAQQHLADTAVPKLADPKLQKVYGQMVKVAGSREELAKGLGLLSDEAAGGRLASAPRVAAGATFVERTAAREGRPSAALEAARARVERLDQLHTRAVERAAAAGVKAAGPKDAVIGGRIVGPGAERVSTSAADVSASRLRLAQLEQERNAELDKMAAGRFGPANRGDVNYRTRENKRAAQQASGRTRSGKLSGASGRKSVVRQTVKDERRMILGNEIEAKIAANPADPVLKRWADREAEIERLQALAHPMIGETAKGVRVGAGRVVSTPGSARAERLGAALSVERDRLQRMEAAAARRVTPTGLLGAEDIGPGEIRIPDVAAKARTQGGKLGRFGSGGTIGHQKALATLTHEFTGALREQALRREDTANLVAESALEMAKHAGMKQLHELVRLAVSPTPLHGDDVAVRLDQLAQGAATPLAVKRFLGDPQEYLGGVKGTGASTLERARNSLFFQGGKHGDPWQLSKELTDAQTAEFQRLFDEGKIGWVPRRLLGELGQTRAPLSSSAGRKAVASWDAINNASRFAILYLKPAYAVPNVLGNLALNILQQGFAAPANLARAARLNRHFGPEVAAHIDAAMGEGLSGAASAHGVGAGSAAVDFAARQWSRVVDVGFRRSSFIFEARKAGYVTDAQLRSLVTDPAHADAFNRVAQEANNRIIDYTALAPVEKEIVRRVIFFYPWVKGSTTYAGRLLRDQPVTSAALAGVGQQGEEFSGQAFPKLPSYLEGLIPFQGGQLASNPTSAAVLQTPAQVLATVRGLLSGNISQAAAASNFLTPAEALAIAEAFRVDPNTGRAFKGGTNAGTVAKSTLTGSLPQVSLARNLKAAETGHGGSKLYPPSVQSALLSFLVGSVAPRKIDRADLARLAALEKKNMTAGGIP